MRVLLSCFFDILREVDLEHVSLVLGEVLVVFLNRFTADGKDPGQDCENLHVQIQMQLSEKRKIFFQLSVTFPESTSNFKHLQKKEGCHS